MRLLLRIKILIACCSLLLSTIVLGPTNALSSSSSDVPFKLQRIDHIVIRCHNFNRMFNFYTKVLGCTIDQKEDVDRFGGALSHLRAGDAYIDLLAYDPDHITDDGEAALLRMHSGGKGIPISSGIDRVSDIDFASSKSTLDHLCLRIDPFDEIRMMIFFKNQGIKVLSSGQRKGAEGVGPSIYIEDPEGNVVELKGPTGQKSLDQKNSEEQDKTPTIRTSQTTMNLSSTTSQDTNSDDPSGKNPNVARGGSSASQGVGGGVGTTNIATETNQDDDHNNDNKFFASTPCTRICRYNSKFYDGQVCIGCFREGHEIITWSSMTPSEKYFTLLDAAERHPDYNDDDDDHDNTESHSFEGSISKDELLRQAEGWANSKQ